MNKVVAIATCCLLFGCANTGLKVGDMLPGKIYAIDEARILPFEIEVTHGHGKVRAVDPITSENYEGTYGAVSESVVASGRTSTYGGKSPLTSYSSGRASSNMAVANAVLIGDQGNVLDCTIDIQKGKRPRGIGTCKDSKGKTYRLQF